MNSLWSMLKTISYSSVLLLIAALSIYCVLSWLLVNRPVRYKAHMLFSEVDRDREREKKKKEGKSNLVDNTFLDKLLRPVPQLSKFAPYHVVSEAFKYEWFISISHYYLILFGSGTALAILFYMILGQNLIAIYAFLLGFFVPRIVLYFKKKEYKRTVQDRLSIYMKSIANSMSVFGNAGEAADNTSDLVHPVLRPYIVKAVSLMHAGKSVTYAFDDLIQAFNYKEVRFFHEMLEVAHESGGEYTDVLMSIAEDFEDKKILQARLEATLTQSKKAFVQNSMFVVLLPFIFFFLQRETYGYLVDSPLGPIVMVVCYVSLVLIYIVLEKIGNLEALEK